MKKNNIIIVVLFSFVVLFSCSKGNLDSSFQFNLNPSTQSVTPARTSLNISGLNWADARDNFVEGWVIPSGLTSNDNYATVAMKTQSILNGFKNKVNGVNTIRIPINPPSVLETWWASYKAVIDIASSNGFKVIIACWESSSSKNGLIDDPIPFWQMWDLVVRDYQNNTNIYFEPFNEPHGYTLAQLTTIYKQFLDRYPTAPKGRIILDGNGYSEDVNGVGGDSRFSDCLLGLHNYAFWANRTPTGWVSDWESRIGRYAARTVITEFGATMNTGKDYQNGPQSDNEIAYIVSTSDVCRNNSIASVYWPGLRDGDPYSLLSIGGSSTNITVNAVNASGIFRLRYGWGF